MSCFKLIFERFRGHAPRLQLRTWSGFLGISGGMASGALASALTEGLAPVRPGLRSTTSAATASSFAVKNGSTYPDPPRSED